MPVVVRVENPLRAPVLSAIERVPRKRFSYLVQQVELGVGDSSTKGFDAFSFRILDPQLFITTYLQTVCQLLC
jgi:hypothetical protein